MERAPLGNIEIVKQQGRMLKNTYVFLGVALMVTSISLAVFVSLGHVILNEPPTTSNLAKNELDFDEIDPDSPIPLLMSAEKKSTEPVKVLGAELTNAKSPKIDSVPPPTLLRDTYIRSFTFVSSQESEPMPTISASWNSRKSSMPQLYTISQTNFDSPTEEDIEIYSVEGYGFEVSSHTFKVDSNEGKLFLSIYELDTNGIYQLKATSLVVQSSN